MADFVAGSGFSVCEGYLPDQPRFDPEMYDLTQARKRAAEATVALRRYALKERLRAQIERSMLSLDIEHKILYNMYDLTVVVRIAIEDSPWEVSPQSLSKVIRTTMCANVTASMVSRRLPTPSI